MRSITITKIGDTTQVKILENGKTRTINSNSNRDLEVYDGGIIIVNDPTETKLNNFKIAVSELTNDGIDFTGIVTGEELANKLAEEKVFKLGSGIAAEAVTNLIYNAINDTQNLLITKGFKLISGFKWFAYTSKYKWDGVITENNYIENDNLTQDPVLTQDFKRFDTIVFNRDLTWGIEKGEEGLNPAHPAIDLLNQIKLTTLLVQYGEVTPTQVVETLIYDENVGMPTEYNVLNPTANIDPDNAENPYTNLKSIKFDKPNYLDHLTLDNGIEKAINSIDALLLTVTCGTKDKHRFVIHIHNSIHNWYGVAIEINKGKYGFDPNKLTPQNLIIPFTDFANPTLLFTGLYISSSTALAGGSLTSVMWIDNIKFQGGFEEAPTTNSPTTPHPTKLSEFENDVPFVEEAPINGKSHVRKDAAWVEFANNLDIVPVASTAYTFLLTDADKKVVFSAATAVTATIPTNAVAAIPIGSKIRVTQSGNGVVTFTTTGLTVVSASPLFLVKGQTIILVKDAINTWTIEGNSLNGEIQFPAYPNTRDDGVMTSNKILSTDANGKVKLYGTALGQAPYLDIVIPDSTLPNVTGNYELYGSFFTTTMTVDFVGQVVNAIDFHNSNWITVNVTTGAAEGLFNIVLNNGISKTFYNVYLVVLGDVTIPIASDWNTLGAYTDVSEAGTIKLAFADLPASGKVNTAFFTAPATGFFRFLWTYVKSPYHTTPGSGSKVNFRSVVDNTLLFYVNIHVANATSCAVVAYYGAGGPYIAYLHSGSIYGEDVFSFRRTGTLLQFYFNETLKATVIDPGVEMYVEFVMNRMDIKAIKSVI